MKRVGLWFLYEPSKGYDDEDFNRDFHTFLNVLVENNDIQVKSEVKINVLEVGK